jgi:hypothetical protein
MAATAAATPTYSSPPILCFLVRIFGILRVLLIVDLHDAQTLWHAAFAASGKSNRCVDVLFRVKVALVVVVA